MGNTWVTLIDESETAAWKKSLAPVAEQAGFHFSFGGKAADLMEIPRSYQEARRTVSLLRDFALPPGIYLYEELSLYGLLQSMTKLPEAKDVWTRYWSPLEEDTSQARRSLPLNVFCKREILKVAKIFPQQGGGEFCHPSLRIRESLTRLLGPSNSSR